MNWDALGRHSRAGGRRRSRCLAARSLVTDEEKLPGLGSPANHAVATEYRLLAVAQIADLATVFAKAPREDPEPTDQLQLTFFTRAFLRGVQNISFQRRAGLVSGRVWEDYEHVLRNYTRLPYAKQFRAGGRHGFDAAFVDRCDPLFIEPPAASS